MQAEHQDVPPIEVELRPARAPRYAALVTLRGEHDLATSGRIAEALSRIAGTILVDLSDCEFIDSTVIRTLLRTSAELTREGYRLDLVLGPHPSVRRIVEVIGLSRLLVTYDQFPTDAEVDSAERHLGRA